jgi:hypothetical protein
VDDTKVAGYSSLHWDAGRDKWTCRYNECLPDTSNQQVILLYNSMNRLYFSEQIEPKFPRVVHGSSKHDAIQDILNGDSLKW